MNILVLGWEYPPTVAGGLGAACHGLTTALARRGHRIFLALPESCRPFGPGASTPSGAAHGDPHDTEGSSGSIERIYLPMDLGDPWARRGSPAFHPYAVDRSRRDQKGPDPVWGSARKLYGDDLFGSVRAYTKSALKRLSGLEVDAIHAHDWMTFPAALQLRLTCRRPVCLHVHSTAFDRGGASAISTKRERGTIAGVERAAVRSADAVCAVSAYTRSVLVEHYGADEKRIHVVHNAPPAFADDVPEEAPKEPRHRAAESEGQSVLFLGRLTRQKGAAFLLRAARLVLDELPETRFLIAGSGDERARLIETAAELGVARRVSFLGPISDSAKRKAYGAADVFVLPTSATARSARPTEPPMSSCSRPSASPSG